MVGRRGKSGLKYGYCLLMFMKNLEMKINDLMGQVNEEIRQWLHRYILDTTTITKLHTVLTFRKWSSENGNTFLQLILQYPNYGVGLNPILREISNREKRTFILRRAMTLFNTTAFGVTQF